MDELTSTALCPTCSKPFSKRKEHTTPRTSRVESLLRQIDPPDPADLDEFKQLIAKFPSTLGELDQKILQTQETLQSLIRVRKNAMRRVDDARALLHPIRSMPPHIMEEIFLYCVPTWDDGVDDDSDSLSPLHPPWSLSHVCRRWREQVISLPKLWSYLQLQFEAHMSNITPKQCAYKTALWFGRSKGEPVSMFIAGTVNDRVQDHPIFPILEATTANWRRLCIDMPMADIQALSGNPFPKLEYLQLDYESTGSTDVVVDTFENAIALRTLHISGDSAPLNSLVLPWGQLEELQQEHAFSSIGVVHLRQMTHLRKLTLYMSNVYQPISGGNIALPDLTELIVIETLDADPGDMKDFLEKLRIPALTTLSLEFPTSIDRRRMCVPRFKHTPAKLVKLCIKCNMTGHPDNTKHIVNFLTQNPQVEELEFKDDALTMAFLGAMKAIGRKVILPRLRVLDICDSWCDEDVLNEEVWEVIESRCVVAQTPPRSLEEPKRASWPSPSPPPPQDPEEEEEIRTALEKSPHCASLEVLRAPRWLFHDEAQRWTNICHTQGLRVECGVSLEDVDDSDDEDDYDDFGDDDASYVSRKNRFERSDDMDRPVDEGSDYESAVGSDETTTG